MDAKKKSFAVNTLRRASYRWPGRWMAEKRSKVGRNQYKCEKCGSIFGKKDTAMDHVQPVVDPEKGWEGFDIYIDRMFADEAGFQRLCHTCHDSKTNTENKVRKETKKKTKKKLDNKQ